MSRNKKVVILMLGGARRVSLGELLIRSGNKLGCDVEILSYELEEHVPIAAIGKVVIGRKWHETDVVEHIAQTVKEYGVNIILPFVDGAVAIAARCKEAMPDVFIPVSSEETAANMFDKAVAADIFANAEIPIPKTYTHSQCQFPAIAKPRLGSASKGIAVLHNSNDLSELQNPERYLIQEYIGNREEYTVDCYISQHGELCCTVPRLRIEVTGGEVNRTRTCRIPEIMKMSNDIIQKIGFRGPVTLQFLHDLDSERYLLMEINPRLGGGVVCSIHSGAPITDFILRESLGLQITPCDDWQNATLMTRYMKEVIFHEQ